MQQQTLLRLSSVVRLLQQVCEVWLVNALGAKTAMGDGQYKQSKQNSCWCRWLNSVVIFESALQKQNALWSIFQSVFVRICL